MSKVAVGCVHVIAAAVLLLVGAPHSAHGWGPNGHRIVCEIAFKRLSASDADEVVRLTGLYRRPDGKTYPLFAEACLFADTARANARDGVKGWNYFNRFNRWHFLNVPRDTDTVKLEHCGFDCVIRGIEYHAQRLANSQLEDWKRAQALFFLGHWVGDVHQPLHVSYEDDVGGNSIKPINGGYYGPYSHLHSVWDSGMIDKAMNGTSWRTYAKRLIQSIPAILPASWTSRDPVEWAQESYAITTRGSVDYCSWEEGEDGTWCAREWHVRRLDADYQEEFEKDVELRLQMAGVRLATAIGERLNP